MTTTETMRNELFNDMIKNDSELTKGYVKTVLKVLDRLDYTKEQLKDKDYMMDQVDNIMEY